MNRTNHYIVVDASALPDVFAKVLDVKSILAKGGAKTSSEACKIVGISRGAYYKYKDKVFVYREKEGNESVTFHFVLEDKPGILSALLTRFYELGANILTVNQNIPNDEVAVVSITVHIPGDKNDRNELLLQLGKVGGVVEVKII